MKTLAEELVHISHNVSDEVRILKNQKLDLCSSISQNKVFAQYENERKKRGGNTALKFQGCILCCVFSALCGQYSDIFNIVAVVGNLNAKWDFF